MVGQPTEPRLLLDDVMLHSNETQFCLKIQCLNYSCNQLIRYSKSILITVVDL